MIIFRNYTFRWWQVSILKVCVLCLGVAIGAYWSEVFLPYVSSLVAVGILLGIYLAYIAFKRR